MTLLSTLFKWSSLLVAITSVFIYVKFVRTEPSPVLSVRNGKLQGIVLESREGRNYYAFLGVPFAKPPVGSLRFEPPVPADNWEGVKDATRYGNQCAQFEYVMMMGLQLGSEDCLTLNVFVPEKVLEGKAKLPVMAYIHGGYFHFGSTDTAGANNFLDHDIILVTIEYRLGALGFLNTGDGVIRGNMGLKDQNLALKWIQDNIENFNGDKDKVTIFGESAGGASTHYHQLSPMSKGLFWKVIRQSGSALNYWTLFRNSREQAAQFGKRVGCPFEGGDSRGMVECLKKMEVGGILDGHRNMMTNLHPLVGKFVPSIETVKDSNAFLTEEPLTLMKEGRFNKVPFMTGFNRDEGLLHSTTLWANQTKLDEAQNWYTWAPQALHYDPRRKEVSQKLRDFYFGYDADKINSKRYIKNFTALYGDRLFTVGVSQAAEIERKHVPAAYTYLFDFPESGFNLGSLISCSQAKTHPLLCILAERLEYLFDTYIRGSTYRHPVEGTSHYDEFPLLFSGIFANIYLNEKDVEMSKDLVKLWVDFAGDRKPLKFRDIEFHPLSKNGDMKFLHISKNPKMIPEPFKDRRLVWQGFNLVPE